MKNNIVTWYNFKFRLNSDSGKHFVTVCSETEEQAKHILKCSYFAPDRAITLISKTISTSYKATY